MLKKIFVNKRDILVLTENLISRVIIYLHSCKRKNFKEIIYFENDVLIAKNSNQVMESFLNRM